jgi:hypothetical protein
MTSLNPYVCRRVVHKWSDAKACNCSLLVWFNQHPTLDLEGCKDVMTNLQELVVQGIGERDVANAPNLQSSL